MSKDKSLTHAEAILLGGLVCKAFKKDSAVDLTPCEQAKLINSVVGVLCDRFDVDCSGADKKDLKRMSAIHINL